MTDDVKPEVAPTLDDLALANVEHSKLFGLTNVSGKIATLAALGGLVVGTTGVLQAFGVIGAVAGATIGLPLTIGVAAGTIAAGLGAYWLGNFDDKRIRAFNESAFGSARRNYYDDIESRFVDALSTVQYEPFAKTLPHDALGYAVFLSDDKIAKLPAHIQLDVYRTQSDLMLYNHSKLTSRGIVEARAFEDDLKNDSTKTIEEKAEAYRKCRNSISAAIDEGTLQMTPYSKADEIRSDVGADFSDAASGSSSSDDNAIGEFFDDLADSFARSARRSRGSSSSGSSYAPWGGFSGGASSSSSGHTGSSGTRSHGGFFTGGGFGGEGGFKTGGAMPVPIIINNGGGNSSGGGFDLGGLFDGGGSSSGSRSSGSSKGAGEAILLAAAVAAASAAYIVTGFAVWKNFISRPEDPEFEGLKIPALSASLRSARKQVEHMYAPS